MAIAKADIQEVYDALIAAVGRNRGAVLLVRLQQTQAYKWNASFRTTVDRLREHHGRVVSQLPMKSRRTT